MPTINVNGAPPGGGQPPGGGGKPPPSAAFQRFTQHPDYARAMNQRDKQASSENSAYDANARQNAQDQARLGRVMRDEIRYREQGLREDERRRREEQRRADANDRADVAFRRRQQADANRRANQQRGHEVGDAMHMDRARTRGQTQERSREHADAMHMDRQRTRTQNQQRGFEFADANAMNRDFNRNDYRVNNIGRMGRMGQRFADTRNWKELAAIEHELKRIERVNEKQLKFSTSPAEQASLQRQTSAILGARQQIAAGRSGNSGLMNSVGGVVGNIGLLLDNPALKIATSVISAAVGAPYAANKAYAGFLGMQRPYTDFRIKASELGRGGAFNGSDLANMILPSGAGSYVPRPGMGRSGEMQALGLGPQDVLRSLSAYGVPTRSARQGLDTAESVRAAYLAPGMMLPEDQLAKMAGQARTATFGQFNNNTYFSQLQKIMALATTQGLDSSRLASSWSGMIQAASSSSVSMNTQGMGDFFSRMVGSGAPNMRTGEGQISMMNDFSNSMAGLGTSGNVAGNVVMSSFLQHAGSPKDEESLRTALKVDKGQWNQMMSTPAAQNALQSYIGAMKAGNGVAAQQYLGVIVNSAGNPAGMTDTIMNTAGFGNLGYLQPIANKNFMGTSLNNSLAAGSTLSSQGMSLGGVAPMAPSDLMPLIAKKADELGIPLNEAMALFAKESNFRSNATVKGSSATGLGQVTKGTAAQFGYSQSDMLDPEKNIDASLRYYAEQRKKYGTGGGAYEAYHYGPGSGIYNTADAAQFNGLSNQYSNNKDVLPYLNKRADEQTANLKASEYVSNVNDVVVAGLTKVADAAERAAAALYKLGSMPGATQRMPGGFMSPDGMWVPLSTPSGQASAGAIK